MIKSFKYRIYPNKEQSLKLEMTLDLCRDLYNASLQERRDAYRINCISLNQYSQQNQLPEIKETNPEYKEVYSQVLQNVTRRVDKSFQNFFRRVKKGGKVGFPRFQNKERYNSFTYPQIGFSLEANKLSLSKIGKLKIKLSRNIVGKTKTCTIKCESDKWYVILTVETVPQELPKTGLDVGIDAGISSFITLSDGSQTDNPRFFESAQKKLRVAQRSLSRKKKGGCNYKKVKYRLRKIHNKIKNQRADFHHKVSTWLVKNYDLIAVENLNVKGMSKGILAKQVNDVGWGNFFSMIRYKAECAGKELKEVPPHYTSQDCSGCGNRIKKELSERTHNCLECGLVLDRDHNAAINILRLGISLSDITYQNTESVCEEPKILIS